MEIATDNRDVAMIQAALVMHLYAVPTIAGTSNVPNGAEDVAKDYSVVYQAIVKAYDDAHS